MSEMFPALIVLYAGPRTPRKSRKRLAEASRGGRRRAEAEGGGLLLAELAELAEM